MSSLPLFVISLLAYVLLVRASYLLPNRRWRSSAFALVNIAAFVWLTLLTRYSVFQIDSILSLGSAAVPRHLMLVSAYLLLVAAGYVLLRVTANRGDWMPWLAFFYPIAVLVLFKYFFFLWKPLIDRFDWDDWVLAATFVGLSYMAFRLSYLVLEVRNGNTEMPSVSEYLGFAFFLPTMLVGPINPYSTHRRSFNSHHREQFKTRRSLMRIVVGSAKFLFIANIANQLSYAGIFLDGKPHPLVDLFVAVIFYYFFLYLNFSGICDIAIGVAGLVKVRVRENFDNPFKARNVKDFWNRWHITLSEYARDVIFSPLSKGLIRKLGVRRSNLAIALSITAVFLVIGIWHGVGYRFAVFGLIHAAGVVANHYYTIFLKRNLSKESFQKYNRSAAIRYAATAATFVYVASSFFVFANTRDMMGIIRASVQNGLPF